MSTYWSLTSKIFTFVYFPFGKCESAPSLNNPVVQEKGQWFATGARHLFELRLALNFIGQCALYYPSLRQPHTLSPFEDSRGRQWRPGVTRLPTTAPPRQNSFRVEGKIYVCCGHWRHNGHKTRAQTHHSSLLTASKNGRKRI